MSILGGLWVGSASTSELAALAVVCVSYSPDGVRAAEVETLMRLSEGYEVEMRVSRALLSEVVGHLIARGEL